MQHVYSLGYQTLTQSAFVALLARLGIKTVLDVRTDAHFRQSDFDGDALKLTLLEQGIHYQHEPQLGVPKQIRDNIRRDHDFDWFFATYSLYIKSQMTRLKYLARIFDGNVAVLCFERDVAHCHRKIVAEELADAAACDVTHLSASQIKAILKEGSLPEGFQRDLFSGSAAG